MAWIAFVWLLLAAVGLTLVLITRESQRRRALAEARMLRNELRLAIDTIPAIVWSTTPDGAVDFMNRAWQDFTGISAEDAVHGRWVETLHPDEADRVHAVRNAAVAAGRAYELDARLRRADGTYRWVLRRAVPLRNAQGQIVRWYGTGTDIHDLKRAQRAARRARERVLEARYTAALEERSRLAREIHDTLLQGFTGIALQVTAVARRTTDPATAKSLGDMVGLAYRTLDDARQAVWDLRAPLLGAGTFPVALRQEAEHAVHGTDLALDFEVHGAERRITEQVEGAVTRVLHESIANVIKHARARSVRVRLCYGARGVRLMITDDGKGFEVDPAFRAYGGHWGLLGMKERASELGGTLTVQSELGGGTTVMLRLRSPSNTIHPMT